MTTSCTVIVNFNLDPGPLSVIPLEIHTLPFCLDVSKGQQTNHVPRKCYSCSHRISPVSICVASSRRELTGLTGNTLACDPRTLRRAAVYSLNRAAAFWLRRISRRFPARDQVSVIPWARRRRSGSSGGNSWEENNVSMWMPVRCVSWWESVFSVTSWHNKPWLKNHKQDDYEDQKGERKMLYCWIWTWMHQ